MVVYAKNFIALAVLCVTACTVSFGQDGSDMYHVEPDKVDESYIGRLTHIDFYRDSFGCNYYRGKKQDESKCDKISLNINNEQVEFKEHRVDDGFNNWFKDQYLESTDKKIKIREFKLIGIEEKTLTFIGYFNVAPFEKEFSFEKKDIFKLLFKDVK